MVALPSFSSYIKKHSIVWITGLLVYLMFQYMHLQCNPVGYATSGISPFIWGIFDTSCVCLFGCLLTIYWRNAKIGCSVSFLFGLVICYVNIIYARLFNTYLPINMLGETNNLPFIEYVGFVCRTTYLKDIILLVLLLIFIIALYITPKVKYEIKDWRTVICSPFVLALIIQIVEICHLASHPCIPSLRDIKEAYFIPDVGYKTFSPLGIDYHCGLVRGELLYGLKNSMISYKLTKSETEEIAKFLNNKRKSVNSREDLIHKNIVILLIESYLSSTSELSVDGKFVTPNLDKFKKNKHVYFNGNIISNVQQGESSDGQLIYMTGLLPLHDEMTIGYLLKDSVPSLAHFLRAEGYSTYMTIPTSKSVWHQSELSSIYGIDFLFGSESLEKSQFLMNDEELIKYAISNEKKMSGPYLHVILTYSTHCPYSSSDELSDKCVCCPKIFPKNYPVEYVNYLKKCHYMDHQIGMYLNYLIKSNKISNTILVILSDHGMKPQYIPYCKKIYDNNKIPFYYFDSDLDFENVIELDRLVANQIDIFPTLLDFIGVKSNYRGLGNSLFSSGKTEITEEMERISANIIRGNYFAQ